MPDILDDGKGLLLPGSFGGRKVVRISISKCEAKSLKLAALYLLDEPRPRPSRSCTYPERVAGETGDRVLDEQSHYLPFIINCNRHKAHQDRLKICMWKEIPYPSVGCRQSLSFLMRLA